MFLDCVIEQHTIVVYSVSSFPGNMFYRKRITSQSSINKVVSMKRVTKRVQFLSEYLTRIVIRSGVVREEKLRT